MSPAMGSDRYGHCAVENRRARIAQERSERGVGTLRMLRQGAAAITSARSFFYEIPAEVRNCRGVTPTIRLN